MPPDDPYIVLGVSPGDGPDEIRSAFRRRARALHPDVNPGPDAAGAFDRARRAYRALMDENARVQVDRERARSASAGGTFTWANIAMPSDSGWSGIDDELDAAFDAMYGG